MFASDVDVTVKNLAVGLKRMQSQRMSSLLNEVDAVLKQDAGPSVAFPVAASMKILKTKVNLMMLWISQMERPVMMFLKQKRKILRMTQV
jgi:hypothetical protein